MPIVSVIIPVYNSETALPRCLDSILRQTFTDYEVILVDDGSSDRSAIICDDYCCKDQRFRCIHQKNQGVSVARNRGIAEARGTFIAFVDSDDYVHSNYLLCLYDLREKFDADFVITGVKYLTEKSEITKEYPRTGKVLENFFCINNISSCQIARLIEERRFNYVYSKLYKSSIIKEKKLCFREDMNLGEDTVFVFDYLQVIDNFVIADNQIYFYIKYSCESLTCRLYSDLYEKYTLINDYIMLALKRLNLWEAPTFLAVNKRRLASAEWTAYAFLKSAYSFPKKYTFLKQLLFNKKLAKTIELEKELVASKTEYKLLRSQSVLKWFLYYYMLVGSEMILRGKSKVGRTLVGRILKKVVR